MWSWWTLEREISRVMYPRGGFGFQVAHTFHSISYHMWNIVTYPILMHMLVKLMTKRFVINITSWHLTFKCDYYFTYLGMNMYICRRCMPILHNGLQDEKKDMNDNWHYCAQEYLWLVYQKCKHMVLAFSRLDNIFPLHIWMQIIIQYPNVLH